MVKSLFTENEISHHTMFTDLTEDKDEKNVSNLTFNLEVHSLEKILLMPKN